MGGEGIRFPLEVDTMDSIAALDGTEAALESVTAAAERTADATRNVVPASARQSLMVMTGGLRLAGVQTGVLSVAMRAATLSSGLLAGGIKGVGTAVKGLGAALGVVGLALVAVGAVVTAIIAVLARNKKALEEQAKAYKELEKVQREYANFLAEFETGQIRSAEEHARRLQMIRAREIKAGGGDAQAALIEQAADEERQHEQAEKDYAAKRAAAFEATAKQVLTDQANMGMDVAAMTVEQRSELVAKSKEWQDAEVALAAENQRNLEGILADGISVRRAIRDKADKALVEGQAKTESDAYQQALDARGRELNDEENAWGQSQAALEKRYAEKIASADLSEGELATLHEQKAAEEAALADVNAGRLREINKKHDQIALDEAKKIATEKVRDASDAAQAEFDVQAEGLAAQLEAAQAQQAAIREAMPEFKAQFVGIAEMQKRIQASAAGMKAPEEVAAGQKRIEKLQQEAKTVRKLQLTALENVAKETKRIADAKTESTFT